ncbi:hypothetical protein CO641_02740 [Lysobacteraceae bacterium NML91-0213]|nr:hypothetical protein CO641_02740 [Xanthomonadaceae bacterium NML91-0213]
MIGEIGKIKAKKNGRQGVVNYLDQTSQYYEQGGDELPPARWTGIGIEHSGLLDPSRDSNLDFACLLAGVNPFDESEQLTTQKREVIAFDVPTSLPKSFSIVMALETDNDKRKQMNAVVLDATDKAMGFLYAHLYARTGKDGKGPKIALEEVYARSVMHMDSREGDPNAHVHNAICNIAKCADGKFRTIDASALYQNKAVASAIFDAELAKGFERLGYNIEREVAKDKYGNELDRTTWRISGIDRSTELAFSKRRKQIEAYSETHATGDAKKDRDLKQRASLSTRRKKDNDLLPHEIRDRTQEAVRQMRQENLIQWDSVEDLRAQRKQQVIGKSTDRLMQELHANESHWDRYDLIKAIAKRGEFHANAVEEADKAIDRALKQGTLIELANDRNKPQRYCTLEQLRMEEDIAGSALARQGETYHHLDKKQVDRALKEHEQELGFSLKDEQRDAVRHVCERTGGMAVITGQAGTGKTTFAGAFVKAFQSAGFEVIGTSTSSEATKNLQNEASITSLNSAQLLNRLGNEKIKLTSNHVLVLDEAGMMGAKTFSSIQRFADQAGAKIVAIGDCAQLQPIEAGNAFKSVIGQIGDATLADKMRQKRAQDLETANVLYDKSAGGKEIMERWKNNNQLHEHHHQGHAIKQLIKDYRADQRNEEDKIILVQKHNDADRITKEMRQLRHKAGELGETRTINVQVGDEGNNIEAKEFAVNDRIRFTLGNAEDDYNNNSMGTIKAFGKNNTMTVAMDEGEEKTINLSAVKNQFNHGYARTVHSAQGLGRPGVYWLANDNISREMALVAFTRTKEDFAVYGSKSMLERVSNRIDAFEGKKSAMELLKPEDRLLSELRIKNKQQAKEHDYERSLFKSDKQEYVAQAIDELKEKKKELEQEEQLDPYNIAQDQANRYAREIRRLHGEGKDTKQASRNWDDAKELANHFKHEGEERREERRKDLEGNPPIFSSRQKWS